AGVFSDAALGPFTPATAPDAPTGYGYEKRMAEQRVMHQNPTAKVVRLGWQIGDRPGSNTMIDFIHRKVREEGAVRASSRWLPACSHVDDTAGALVKAVELPPGIFMAESNRRWTFFDIVSALAERHRADWRVVPVEDFVYDQ